MALSRLLDLVWPGFTFRASPGSSDKITIEEIRRAMEGLRNHVIIAADAPPGQVPFGTIRIAKAPWDPLSTGFEGPVWFNGTNWVSF